MIRYALLLPTILATMLLAGCASKIVGPTRDLNDPTNSLVFLYIDMEDAPTGIDTAILRSQPDGYIWYLRVEDGLLYQRYLPPGSYKVSRLVGTSFLHGEALYDLPTYGQDASAIRIQKPGVYFLGSFKYKELKTAFFEAKKADFERVGSPTELELLNRMLNEDWVKGSQWDARIRARIMQLSDKK